MEKSRSTGLPKSSQRGVTLNKADLIDVIAKKAELTKTQAQDALNTLTEVITKSLSKGQKVTIMGFGSWEVRTRAARQGRNPQTGKQIKIRARKVAKFNPGKELKTTVA